MIIRGREQACSWAGPKKRWFPSSLRSSFSGTNSFLSPDTGDDVVLMVQKIRNFPFGETCTQLTQKFDKNTNRISPNTTKITIFLIKSFYPLNIVTFSCKFMTLFPCFNILFLRYLKTLFEKYLNIQQNLTRLFCVSYGTLSYI